MEFFDKAVAVRLKTHLDKYLVADQDQLTVRQSQSAAAGARWLIENVDSNKHVIRLKSCYGRYLTASNTPFLLGMTGKKVFQSLPENTKDLAIEWQPLRDGFQVKLKAASSGTYLRANGAMLPWRNTVTHDSNNSTHNWILFHVEPVPVPEDDLFGSRFSPIFSMNKTSVMDLFDNAKAVRLKNHHNKYLHADEDEESVSQDRNGSSKNNRWTVEFITPTIDSDNNTTSFIRLKSCYNKYLTASKHPFLLGMTGRKVLQTLPTHLDSSLDWEPIRQGNQVKLRTRYGQYLRANAGLPPWRNSVTHDVPHRTATQEWILWDVDVVDILLVQSPVPPPPPRPNQDLSSSSFTTYSSDSSSPTPTTTPQQQPSAPKLVEQIGRWIYYHVVSEGFGEIDENAQGFCIHFKGNNVIDLTKLLEEETGLNNITVCTRSPLNGKLYPLRLQLPPNNVTMNVVVVQNNHQDAN